MNSIIGIDLGVEEVSMARINPVGDPELTFNNANLYSTPAAVFLSADNVVIGNMARDSAEIEEHAFAEFLRDLGRGITHKTPHGTFSPSDLCALLLRPLIEHFRSDYGAVSTLAIAIPYNLGDEARSEVLRAATLAGVYKPDLINDNTAEALYLRNAHKLKKGRYLLVSLRAGTADVTIFEVERNSLSIVHVSGIQQLGLKDLKHSMMEIVSEKIAQELGGTVTEQELFMDCCIGIHCTESLIETLGVRCPAELRALSTKKGLIRIKIARKEFEKKITSLTRQLEYLIESALEKAGVSPRDLNGCFLSASEIDRSFWAPCIHSALGMQPISTPKGSVAMGAALYAANKAQDDDLPIMGFDELKSVKVQDVAPYFVGILEIDWLTRKKRNRIVIPKGEYLPCKRTFELVADDSGRIPEIVVTLAYVSEDDSDQVGVLTSIKPTQAKAGSKHTLTISINDNGQTSAILRNDEDGSSYFMEMKA
jgi:molecular chaperone DnaK (HSP70)